jgi:uncharacterized protein YgiM (DUF1202 family)
MTRFKVVIALVGMGSALALAGCASNKTAEAPAAAAPAAAAAAPQPSAASRVEVTANSLNIRKTATANGAVVGTLKRGDRVSALEAESGGWQYVESDSGAKGYVASKYLQPISGAAAAASKPAPAKPAAGNAIPGTRLARVTVGMTEAQVIEILGAPTSQGSYFSPKFFIPWGKESGRMEYRYKGVGIVTFSHHRYSGANTVIKTTSNPNETGFKQ